MFKYPHGDLHGLDLDWIIEQLKYIRTKLDELDQVLSDANTDKLVAEGYAVGTQNGVAVGSDSVYYHNNAKYYSDIYAYLLSDLNDLIAIKPELQTLASEESNLSDLASVSTNLLELAGKNAVWIGDSYVEANSLGADQDKRFSTKICEKLGLTEYNFAVGGSDWLAPMGDTFEDQIEDANSSMTSEQKYFTKYVFICGGRNVPYNTPTYTLGQLFTEFKDVLTKAETYFPNAIIVVVPLLWDATAMPQTYQTFLGNIMACCCATYWRGFYVSNAFNWLTGKVGAILSDGIHPNVDGHATIASYLMSALLGVNNRPAPVFYNDTQQGITVKYKLINGIIYIDVSGTLTSNLTFGTQLSSFAIGQNGGILTNSQIMVTGTTRTGQGAPFQFNAFTSGGICNLRLQYIGDTISSGETIDAHGVAINGLEYYA